MFTVDLSATLYNLKSNASLNQKREADNSMPWPILHVFPWTQNSLPSLRILPPPRMRVFDRHEKELRRADRILSSSLVLYRYAQRLHPRPTCRGMISPYSFVSALSM
jgi:hypothetical protein